MWFYWVTGSDRWYWSVLDIMGIDQFMVTCKKCFWHLNTGWNRQTFFVFCLIPEWLFLFKGCVCETDKKTEGFYLCVCVCVSRKHFVWLVTRQLCKLNTTRFVPLLVLYYAITPFGNEQEWKQWSPLCFPALSSAPPLSLITYFFVALL